MADARPARATAGRDGGSRLGRGRHHGAGAGRGRVRAGAGRVRRRRWRPSPSSTASCSSPTRSRPASAGPASCSPREHYGLVPDLITTAKSLAGGLPLAAVTGRADVMEAPQVGGLGGTYGGNPLACAAAIAVLDAMEAERIPAHAQRTGDRVKARFQHWADAVRLHRRRPGPRRHGRHGAGDRPREPHARQGARRPAPGGGARAGPGAAHLPAPSATPSACSRRSPRTTRSSTKAST